MQNAPLTNKAAMQPLIRIARKHGWILERLRRRIRQHGCCALIRHKRRSVPSKFWYGRGRMRNSRVSLCNWCVLVSGGVSLRALGAPPPLQRTCRVEPRQSILWLRCGKSRQNDTPRILSTHDDTLCERFRSLQNLCRFSERYKRRRFRRHPGESQQFPHIFRASRSGFFDG